MFMNFLKLSKNICRDRDFKNCLVYQGIYEIKEKMEGKKERGKKKGWEKVI